MNDLAHTIAPKSDQLNADDLVGGPRTITITEIKTVRTKGEPQPTSIHFEGDDGRPYKPCLSMRRVLAHVWGLDSSVYAGRRLTIYRDETVQFGGAKVGGIRISHVSGIEKSVKVQIATSRGKRGDWPVEPLPVSSRDRLYAAARLEAKRGEAALSTFRNGLDPKADAALALIEHELRALAADAGAQADRVPADEETV